MQTQYILPISFLGETMFVCGHDDGRLVLGGHGVDAVHVIGQTSKYPLQLVVSLPPLVDRSNLIVLNVSRWLTCRAVTILHMPHRSRQTQAL
jgi:hypothetical protein